VAIPFSGLMNIGAGHVKSVPGEKDPGLGRIHQFTKSRLPRRED